MDISHFLHLSPSISLELVRMFEQGLQVILFQGLEQFIGTSLLSSKEQLAEIDLALEKVD